MDRRIYLDDEVPAAPAKPGTGDIDWAKGTSGAIRIDVARGEITAELLEAVREAGRVVPPYVDSDAARRASEEQIHADRRSSIERWEDQMVLSRGRIAHAARCVNTAGRDLLDPAGLCVFLEAAHATREQIESMTSGEWMSLGILMRANPDMPSRELWRRTRLQPEPVSRWSRWSSAAETAAAMSRAVASGASIPQALFEQYAQRVGWPPARFRERLHSFEQTASPNMRGIPAAEWITAVYRTEPGTLPALEEVEWLGGFLGRHYQAGMDVSDVRAHLEAHRRWVDARAIAHRQRSSRSQPAAAPQGTGVSLEDLAHATRMLGCSARDLDAVVESFVRHLTGLGRDMTARQCLHELTAVARARPGVRLGDIRAQHAPACLRLWNVPSIRLSDALVELIP